MPSGGDAVSCLSGGDAAVAVVCVSVADVMGERISECVPVEVVGVTDDELAESGEVTLDWIQVAGVGRGRNELDPVRGREGADRRDPVGGGGVPDPVDPAPRGGGEPDLAHERGEVSAGSSRTQPDPGG